MLKRLKIRRIDIGLQKTQKWKKYNKLLNTT